MDRTLKAVCYCYSFGNPLILGYNDKQLCRGVAIHAAMAQEPWIKVCTQCKPFEVNPSKAKRKREKDWINFIVAPFGFSLLVCNNCVALLLCHVFTSLNKDSHIDRKLWLLNMRGSLGRSHTDALEETQISHSKIIGIKPTTLLLWRAFPSALSKAVAVKKNSQRRIKNL